jgi:hypothetical protein
MTVKKVFSYGEHQPDLYGAFNSGVTYLEETNHRLLVTNGNKADFNGELPYNPHVVEVTEDGQEVFHLVISNAITSATRTGRIDLYHPQL